MCVCLPPMGLVVGVGVAVVAAQYNSNTLADRASYPLAVVVVSSFARASFVDHFPTKQANSQSVSQPAKPTTTGPIAH